MTTTNTFKNSDEFANYILDSVLDFGEVVTEEFNKITGLSLPVGTNLSKVKYFPNAGENYAKFESVKGWLYDLYEIYISDSETNEEYRVLSDLISSFDGDPITICFKNKMVKKVCECGDNTTMFQTEDGILISVSNNKLKINITNNN